VREGVLKENIGGSNHNDNCGTQQTENIEVSNKQSTDRTSLIAPFISFALIFKGINSIY
jgi:hypothetical protein